MSLYVINNNDEYIYIYCVFVNGWSGCNGDNVEN